MKVVSINYRSLVLLSLYFFVFNPMADLKADNAVFRFIGLQIGDDPPSIDDYSPPSIPPPPLPPPPLTPKVYSCQKQNLQWSKKPDPLPLVEWLNLSNLPNFFEPILPSFLNQEVYFNDFRTLNQYHLSLQPYGFHSSYKLKGDNFKLNTFGIMLESGMTLSENWILGAGAGYGYSNFDWGELAQEGEVNTVYFGPYAAYMFDKGYINFLFVSAYNMYDINQPIEDKNRWDLLGVLQGGMDFKASDKVGSDFFIQPNVNLSYLAALQKKRSAKIQESKLKIPDHVTDFFRSRIAFELRKEIYQEDKRKFVIPSVSIGWVLMKPISTSSAYYTCQEHKHHKVYQERFPTSHQLYLGAKLIGIYSSGILISLNLDAYIAKLYPAYSGHLRFEWNW